MFDLLKDFLNARTSPEAIDTMLALDDALTRAGFDTHHDEIDYLITRESFEDPESVVPSIDIILRVAADTVLAGWQVEVEGNIPLPMLADLVDALTGFDIADDAEAISAILEDSISGPDALAEILELRTQYIAEQWMPHLLYVNDSLIVEMTRILIQFQETQSIDTSALPEVMDRVNRYTTQLDNASTLVAMEHGLPLGLSMENLYKRFHEDIAAKPIDQAVKELTALTLISGVSNEALFDEAQFFLEDLYPSLEDNQKANRLLKQEFKRIQSQGDHHA